MPDHPAHQRPVYERLSFLESEEARPLRILAEYLEPLERFWWAGGIGGDQNALQDGHRMLLRRFGARDLPGVSARNGVRRLAVVTLGGVLSGRTLAG